jgi:hypothetical protein
MSKKPESADAGAKAQKPAGGGGDHSQGKATAPAKVVPITANKCLHDECKAKPDKAGFCSEHFTWYKEGLINGQGHKVPDFDKKWQASSRRPKVA